MSESSWQRLVVKVGTSTLVDPAGHIKYPVINRLAQTLSSLQQNGHHVILVTSGAVGIALEQMSLSQRPSSIPHQQALAALGQGYLMSIYNQSFAFYHQLTGQVLLTYDVFDNPKMRHNMINALETMLAQHIIPVINENDVIAVDEMDHRHSFGDNDKLAAMVAQEVNADGIIVLSDVDALYTSNPALNADAKPIHRVYEITDAIRCSATGSTSNFGTGGMATKLAAAEIMLLNHSKMVLINGDNPALILDVVKGKQIGTLFEEEK